MASNRGKYGAAALAAGLIVIVIAGAGWWLGGRDIRPAPPAESVAAPVATQAALPRLHDARLGPFAPPIPDTPSAPVPSADAAQEKVSSDSMPPDMVAVTPSQALSPALSPVIHPPALPRNDTLPPPHAGQFPLIAIIIDDLGIAPAQVAAALALPAPMIMAVLPYARNAAQIAKTAREQGHEVLLHLPMEATNGQDPGPQALLAGLPPAIFSQRLAWNLSRLDGYAGVNNHMGSKLTQDPVAMSMLMAEIKRRGLLFLDSRTDARTIAASTARNMGVTTVQRDIFLDNMITPDAIRAQLHKTEAIARRNGFAIAIGHPHQVTLDVLSAWAAGLQARGLTLAPLFAITRLQPNIKHVVSLPPPGG